MFNLSYQFLFFNDKFRSNLLLYILKIDKIYFLYKVYKYNERNKRFR